MTPKEIDNFKNGKAMTKDQIDELARLALLGLTWSMPHAPPRVQLPLPPRLFGFKNQLQSWQAQELKHTPCGMKNLIEYVALPEMEMICEQRVLEALANGAEMPSSKINVSKAKFTKLKPKGNE